MTKHSRISIRAILLCITLCAVSAASALLLYAAFPQAVSAAEGDGTGGGIGANNDIPLTLENSSVRDGASGVPRNETIQLDFNKNICNITVLPNNKKCFHLTEVGGDPVAVKITFPDNQVQAEYRRQVFLTPAEPLKPETEYRVSVDSTLTAKNGTVIDNAHTLTFTTGTKSNAGENRILGELGDFVVVYELSLAETGDSVPVDKTALAKLNDTEKNSESALSSMSLIVGAIFVSVLLAAVIIAMLRRKKR